MRLQKRRVSIFLSLVVLMIFGTAELEQRQTVFLNKAFAYAYHEGSSTLRTSSSGATEFSLETSGNVGGEIRIRTWEKDEVLVKYEKKAKADTKKEAREFAEMIEFDLHKTGDVITLEVSTPRKAPWQGTDKSVRVYLDIFIPKDFNLISETISFDYYVTGPLKNVEIDGDNGKIYVKGVLNETDLSTCHGEVRVEDLTGGVNIETCYGAIYLYDVDTHDKTAYLKTAYDKIDMRKIRGNIKAKTNYSSIKGADLELLEGISSFETVYNKIDLQIKELKDCDLFIDNTYGNVYLGIPPTVSAEVSFSIDPGGKIETLGLPILIQSIDQTSLQGILGEGESKIEVEVSGIGKILLESY